MFSNLKEAPADPILGLSQAFKNDPSPDKVDLGIGVYRDEFGKAPVLKAVKAAEGVLLESQETKEYIGSAGNAAYREGILKLLLGDSPTLLSRAACIQSPGGTGALRIASDFIKKFKPEARVFIPEPTWTNHKAIFPAAGLELVTYPYYDIPTGTISFDEMMSALGELRSDDVLVLHGCCHNPTGADLTDDQWREVSQVLQKTGAMPLVDCAYQGFGSGLDRDAAAIRALALDLEEMIVASSCSKNFALYRERVGALTVIGKTPDDTQKAFGHLMPVVRTNYSMPPDHGAAVVSTILHDNDLKQMWEQELTAMRERVNGIRRAFAAQLAKSGAGHFDHVGHQTGMFALLAISPQQVKALREDHHVHMTMSGRLNVAGLKADNVERVAAAVAGVS